MRASGPIPGASPYSVVVITLDAHAAGPAARIAPRLARDFPGLTLSIHAAAEWAENPASLARARAALASADLVIANLIFIEEHIRAILPDLPAARLTGMTRFATFWVEDGQIRAPVDTMRFDDALFDFLGPQLEALTREPELLLPGGTYGARQTGSMALPGALLSRFTLTL